MFKLVFDRNKKKVTIFILHEIKWFLDEEIEDVIDLSYNSYGFIEFYKKTFFKMRFPQDKTIVTYLP